jgi:hypothetical protein
MYEPMVENGGEPLKLPKIRQMVISILEKRKKKPNKVGHIFIIHGNIESNVFHLLLFKRENLYFEQAKNL